MGRPASPTLSGSAAVPVCQAGRHFYEVYRDEAALEAHRATPHYAVWRSAADSLEGPIEATRCRTVFAASRAYWGQE